MSFFTKNRIRNWLLIFLLVTNVATIGTIFYHRWKFRPGGPDRNTDMRFRLKEFIEHDLNFSTAQKTTLKTEKTAIEAKKDSLFDELDNFRVIVYNEYAKPKPNTAYIDSIAIQTGVTFAEINKSSLMEYNSLFNICDNTQKEKLSKFFKDMAADIVKEMKDDACGKNGDGDGDGDGPDDDD